MSSAHAAFAVVVTCYGNASWVGFWIVMKVIVIIVILLCEEIKTRVRNENCYLNVMAYGMVVLSSSSGSRHNENVATTIKSWHTTITTIITIVITIIMHTLIRSAHARKSCTKIFSSSCCGYLLMALT